MAQQPENSLKPEIIISIILKRRWFIIIPFCLAIIVGIYLSFVIPKEYETSTLIIVQAQKVPDTIVQSVVSSDISSRLNTITQQVKSVTNIKNIIETYHLFDDPKYENMFLEDKVEIIRDRIEVNTGNSKDKELTAFSISYRGELPERVQNIANALADYVINKNYENREAQAVSTSDFLADELEDIERQLEESDKRLSEYRQKYMGELPDQLEYNQNMLQILSSELLDQQQALRETNNALAALEQQIAESQHNAATSLLNTEGENVESTDLDTLRAQLESLRMRYTENWPKVVQLKEMIRKLEEQGDDTGSEDGSSENASGKTIKTGITATQENQLATLKLQKQNIETEIVELKNQKELFEKRVENTWKREEEMLGIERDYNNLKSSYDDLSKRSKETQLSLNMERKQKGEQFDILDKAPLPQRPVSPDTKKLFLLAIAAGLGIGCGLVFLLEFMNSSFKSADEAESLLGLPVLATIPSIQHPRDRKLSLVNDILSLTSVVLSFFLLAIFAVIAVKGADTALEMFKKII